MGVGLCTYDASNKTHVEAMMSQAGFWQVVVDNTGWNVELYNVY